MRRGWRRTICCRNTSAIGMGQTAHGELRAELAGAVFVGKPWPYCTTYSRLLRSETSRFGTAEGQRTTVGRTGSPPYPHARQRAMHTILWLEEITPERSRLWLAARPSTWPRSGGLALPCPTGSASPPRSTRISWPLNGLEPAIALAAVWPALTDILPAAARAAGGHPRRTDGSRSARRDPVCLPQAHRRQRADPGLRSRALVRLNRRPGDGVVCRAAGHAPQRPR